MSHFHKPALTILFACLTVITLTAQSSRKVLKKANRQIEWEQFEQATATLAPLVEKKDPEATLLTGYSLLNTPGKLSQATAMLRQAVDYFPLDSDKDPQAIEARFYLGQALHRMERCNEALEIFTPLRAQLSDGTIKEGVDREIAWCNNLIKLKENPVNIRIEHLGSSLNSPWEEHSPIVMYDESTIYFTSNRPVKEYGEEGPYFENIYVSHWRNGDWTSPKLVELPNMMPGNRATVSLTPDGQGLVFFQNEGRYGQLYITRRTFSGWSTPEKLPAPINSGHAETHASFSSDGGTIYFSSDRPGGYGGKDIYISHQLPDGSWGPPINPGPAINTPLDEEGPFIHPDGKTLYFSSAGHNSGGGFDIFSSVLQDDGQWQDAQNMGYPINTPEDDLFFIPTPSGRHVYYASQQEDGLGASDLYLIHLSPGDDRSLAVVSSHVFNSNNQPAENANIKVTDAETGESMGTFRVNPVTGKFIAIVPTGNEYVLTIESEAYHTFTQKFNLPLRDEYGSTRKAIYLPAITLKGEKKAAGNRQ